MTSAPTSPRCICGTRRTPQHQPGCPMAARPLQERLRPLLLWMVDEPRAITELVAELQPLSERDVRAAIEHLVARGQLILDVDMRLRHPEVAIENMSLTDQGVTCGSQSRGISVCMAKDRAERWWHVYMRDSVPFKMWNPKDGFRAAYVDGRLLEWWTSPPGCVVMLPEAIPGLEDT